jgi:hypothetical protein
VVQRKLSNWLEGLAQYVEDTEAPRPFWLWAGIFTINAALQRRVWVRYGLRNVYPNIYLTIIAPPGERKGDPPKLAKKILEKIDIPVAVDSSSKRSMTQELAETARKEQYVYEGKSLPMASMAIVSEEFSTLLAVDPKGIIELLTDLYDSPDVWKYKTSGKGEDYLYRVCTSLFVVTTPTWFMNNLPQEAIGGGFTSRNIIISEGKRHKSVPWPTEPNEVLFNKLILDLKLIKNIVGEVAPTPEAKNFFIDWYNTIPQKKASCRNDKVVVFLNRIHVIALKVSLAIHFAYSDSMQIELEDMQKAIELCDSVIPMVGYALGGQGRSQFGPDVERVMRQIRTLKKTTFKELMGMNYSDLDRNSLKEVLGTIEAMKRISLVFSSEIKDVVITWKKEE